MDMSVDSSRRGQPPVAAECSRRWVGWRREQLARVGFDEVSAAKLAGGDEVDLHQVLDLVARGCPLPLATRILAPLTDNERYGER